MTKTLALTKNEYKMLNMKSFKEIILLLVLVVNLTKLGNGETYADQRLRRGLKKPDGTGGGGGGGGGTGGPYICDNQVDPPTLIWTLQDVAQNRSFCNIVFYDRVYYMEEFIDIHKGGAWAIIRNCGTDATWLFENLQCIAAVPDHFEGMLNMCNNYIVGAIEGSAEDPCATTDAGETWTPPEYEWPDFESCDVYDNITCNALRDYAPTDLEVNGDLVPVDGRWTAKDVADVQDGFEVDMILNKTEHCFVILHDWIFDLGTNPLDGSAPFYKKHGNGWYPQAILKHCGKDMTSAFDAEVDKNQQCVPDHTLGGMNVLAGYVVGVLKDSERDPCVTPPPTPCEAYVSSDLATYTMDEIGNLSDVGCAIVVLGKVYDLLEFSQYHHGGSGQILGKCGSDITEKWLSKDFHIPLIHLGSIQRFQIGVIQDSIGDPCSEAYDPEWDF